MSQIRAMIPIGPINFLLTLHANFGIISYDFQDKCNQNWPFSTPHSAKWLRKPDSSELSQRYFLKDITP